MRSPVSCMKYELESLISGAYGKVSGKMKTALEETRSFADRLTRIIEDLLHITAFKASTNILSFTKTSFKSAVEDSISELKNEIKRSNIAVTYPQGDDNWPELMMDQGKIREAIFTIIENAVRYNLKNGSITISTAVSGGDFILVIRNTGIGFKAEEKEAIATALFYRGAYARSVYPTGMGVGLTTTKTMIKAHGGTLTIESEGEGQGAEVSIRLPMNKT